MKIPVGACASLCGPIDAPVWWNFDEDRCGTGWGVVIHDDAGTKPHLWCDRAAAEPLPNTGGPGDVWYGPTS